MYSLNEDVVQELRSLVHRPAWQGEAKVLLFARQEGSEAALEWWRYTFGEGPPVELRNIRSRLPGKVLTPDGRRVVPGETQTEPADMVLVDSRHPDVAAFWRRFSDVPVHELEVVSE